MVSFPLMPRRVRLSASRASIEKMGSNDAEKELAMLAMLAEVAPAALHDLDMADYATLQKALTDFF